MVDQTDVQHLGGGVTLRAVGVEAAGALALVGAASFLESYAGMLPGPPLVAHCGAHHTAVAWRAVLAAAGAACWIVEAERGAPVGYALLTAPDIPGMRAGDAELRRIYLLSRFQGGGRGTAMLAAAAGEARARGAARLVLGVWERNAAAIGFYRRQGFAQIATRRFDMGGLACDDLVLARAL